MQQRANGMTRSIIIRICPNMLQQLIPGTYPSHNGAISHGCSMNLPTVAYHSSTARSQMIPHILGFGTSPAMHYHFQRVCLKSALHSHSATLTRLVTPVHGLSVLASTQMDHTVTNQFR